jgi:DeoR/GlpR family transcriptional regulator of sugar metabolism
MTDKFKYRESKEENPEEKEKIARKAAGLIEPHDIVFIGEGTTPSLILSYTDPQMPFTVFSNNHGIVIEGSGMKMVAKLIFLGGKFNSTTCSTAGSFTLEMIGRINASKVFLGVDGFSLRAGLTASNHDIAAINRAMIRQTTGSVILLSHFSKFGLVAAMEIAKPKEIDALITNIKMSRDFLEDMESLGIRLITA